MSDLPDLLDRAAGPGGTTVDATADLARARRALARTRARRAATGLAGLAAVGVLGLALTRGGEQQAPVATDPTPSPTTSTPATPATPEAGPAPEFYAVPAAPDGWELQGANAYGVTYARPGDITSPDDFVGKIVVTFSSNRHYGEERLVEGRPFWVLDSGEGYLRVTVATRAGEPKGHLELQFPGSAWSVEEAIAFLGEVRALDGAETTSG